MKDQERITQCDATCLASVRDVFYRAYSGPLPIWLWFASKQQKADYYAGRVRALSEGNAKEARAKTATRRCGKRWSFWRSVLQSVGWQHERQTAHDSK